MKGMEQRKSSIEIYRSPEGNIELNVKLENDTVWLTQSQMAELFGRDRTVISRHVNNCFKEGELDKSLVCAKFAHTKKYGRHDGFEQVVETEYYNLDVIISVGYRVKSINGTRFRQWANSILKQYIIKGYAINQKRLDNYNELKEVVRLMSRAITLQDQVSEGEYNGLFNVISDYVYALDTLGKDFFTADIMAETVRRSSLKNATSGDFVNLERAMAADGRFGGHIVSGHVDGTGTILSMKKEENAVWVTISAPPSIMKFIVEKGSVCLDGISLTVAAVGESDFKVSVIPHTGEETTLLKKKSGNTINIENDIIGKYVDRLLNFKDSSPSEGGGITMDFLRKYDF